MASILLADGKLEIDNAGGTLTDISEYVMSSTLSGNIIGAQHRTIGTGAGAYATYNSKIAYALEVTVKSTTDTDGGKNLLLAWLMNTTLPLGSRSFRYSKPDATTVGGTVFTGELVPNGSFNAAAADASSGDVETITFTFNVDGNVVKAVTT